MILISSTLQNIPPIISTCMWAFGLSCMEDADGSGRTLYSVVSELCREIIAHKLINRVGVIFGWLRPQFGIYAMATKDLICFKRLSTSSSSLLIEACKGEERIDHKFMILDLKCPKQLFHKTDWSWYSLFINELNSRWRNNWLISSPSQRYDYDISFDGFTFFLLHSESQSLRPLAGWSYKLQIGMQRNSQRAGRECRWNENLQLHLHYAVAMWISRWTSASHRVEITLFLNGTRCNSPVWLCRERSTWKL